MKSVLPLAAGIIGVGALIYIYLRQRDKNKKRKPTDDDKNGMSTVDYDTNEETLEFKVQNDQVTLIVGRNSLTLKSIEEKTKTSVRFREYDEDNQFCMITGKPNDVKAAKQLIDIEAAKPIVITDEFLVPTSSCGKIEGYSGSILQEICQKSSAKVWIDPATRKNQGENRRVLITGTKEQVELAKKLIDEKIKEPVNSMENSFSSSSLTIDDKKDDRSTPNVLSPYASNSSITATDIPREILLPSPEKLRNNEGQLEVFVSAVTSPSRFWVQLCGPQSTELEFLVDAMTEYYNQKENIELHAIREPYLGQIVAAMYLADNKWYRAEIVAIQPNEAVSNELLLDVYFLDYGDQQFVGRKDILELRADFLSLRFQAIECFLAHIQPTNSGGKFEEWDRKAIEEFESLVQPSQWKKLISKVVTYKEKKSFALQRQSKQRESSPIPGVELYEENMDKNIAVELVKGGHARFDEDRFGDLAKSAVLNVADEKEEEKKPEKKEVEKPDKNEVEIKDKKEAENRVKKDGNQDVKIEHQPKKDVQEKKKENIGDDKKVDEKKPSLAVKNDEIIEKERESISLPYDKNTLDDNEKTFPQSSQQSLDKDAKPDDSIQLTEAEKEDSNFNNNNNNLDPKLITNGKSQPKRAAEHSNIFPDSSKTTKLKKKQKPTTADFLKNEQQGSSSKTTDWNAMLDE